MKLSRNDVLKFVVLVLAEAFIAGIGATMFFFAVSNEIARAIGISVVWVSVLAAGILFVFGPPWASRDEPPSTATPGEPQEAGPESEPEEYPEVELGNEEIPSEISLTQKQLKAVLSIIEAKKTNAAYWEYQYLGLFLAQQTVNVLGWFSTLGTSIDDSMFGTIWAASIPKDSQRRVVLDALLRHTLIESVGGNYQITERGKNYLEWSKALRERG